MHRNNNQYKIGDEIMFNRKKNSKHTLKSMVLSLITQINDNSTVRFQKVIINDAANICRINHSSTKTYQQMIKCLKIRDY